MTEAFGWKKWAETLQKAPDRAMTDLLRGAADTYPYERLTPADFLRQVLPRDSFIVHRMPLLGESPTASTEEARTADLSGPLDSGLAAWFGAQAQAEPPPAEKLSAYAAQVCEALDLLNYFVLPHTRSTLSANRDQYLKWLAPLAISDCRDPVKDYLKVLAHN